MPCRSPTSSAPSPTTWSPWPTSSSHHPAILDVAQAVLGPDLLCWSTDFFIKDARQPGYVTWHQDLTYWGLDGTDEATAWVALSPSTVQSGCMRVYPGSHKRDIVPHRDTFASDNMLSRGQRLAEEIDESKAADLVLAPGQISLHHGRIFHASGPNRSDDRRIGFAIRYIAPSMRQARGTGAWAHLVRGTDEYRHFEHLPRPRVDFEPGALAMRARIVGAMEEVLYDGAAESGNRQQVTGSS